MENCIFCKIVKNEIPSERVYEDADFIAVLSISPDAPGHSIVIPKTHYRWVWDVPNAGAYFEAARKIALAQKKAFGTEFVISKIIGEEVPHAHIHILPGDRSEDKKDFKLNAEKIRRAL